MKNNIFLKKIELDVLLINLHFFFFNLKIPTLFVLVFVDYLKIITES